MRFAMRSRRRSCRSCTPSASAASSPAADFLHARVPEAAQRATELRLMKLVGLNLDDTTLAFTVASV